MHVAQTYWTAANLPVPVAEGVYISVYAGLRSNMQLQQPNCNDLNTCQRQEILRPNFLQISSYH